MASNTSSPTHPPNPWGCIYVPPSPTNLALGIFLIVATIISYLPQVVSIVRRKSSEGMSYFSLGLGLFAGLLSLINGGMLKWEEKITCCERIRLKIHECLAHNLLIEQLCIGPLCFFVLYIVYLMYFSFTPNERQTREDKQKEYRYARIFFAIYLAAFIILCSTAAILYYVAGVNSHYMGNYAKVCGIASALITLVMWVPQLYTTWRLKSPGSLSIPMLCIQIPGSLLVVYFQIGEKADITTWGPYVVNALQEFLLVVLCVWFIIVNRRKKQASEDQKHLLVDREKPVEISTETIQSTD